jgi:ATP-dependent exoDNAse (exonuclease V) beta subunit
LSEKVTEDLNRYDIIVRNLDKNWRSAPQIIQFNNAFFEQAVYQIRAVFLESEDNEHSRTLANAISEAYSDVYQHVQKTDEMGYVHLEMLEKEEKDAEETWQNKVLEGLPQRLEGLQDIGYALSDIAILVRDNKDAKIIADYLLIYSQENPHPTYRYDVLSNESLLICNSISVKWLIATMSYILDPDNKINRAFLQYEYDRYFCEKINLVEQSITQSLDADIVNLRTMPVYELVTGLITKYRLADISTQLPFLQAFQDILLQYVRSDPPDIHSFLNWWEDNKDDKFISMPDNQDAIRLITIHKSKGLEFDAVLIPFCDWVLCKYGKTLWCSPEEEPFSDMKLLPVRFEEMLANTIFSKEYQQEKMLTYIDNLNLLYVAFTRARKALFISMPAQEKDSFLNVRNLIHRVLNAQIEVENGNMDNINLSDTWNSETKIFEIGKLER